VTYFADLSTAFPDAAFEGLLQHETADTAIDEGYFTGMNGGPIETGEVSPSPPRAGRFVSASVTWPR
jgi:hypothetical protein